MPSKVRIISPRNSGEWDDIVRTLRDAGAWRERHTYFGLANQQRADSVRRKLRTAGKHLGISVDAFWSECGGCDNGGPECAYHVDFSIHTPEEARAYMAAKAAAAGKKAG